MGDGDGLKCWHSHRKWKQQLARWTQIADLQKCVTKKKLMNQKTFRLCPKIEYFGISVPFCYYSLLGRVIDFPSRVRVVKKIPSTGRVASTRHSLITALFILQTKSIWKDLGEKLLCLFILFSKYRLEAIFSNSWRQEIYVWLLRSLFQGTES